MVKYVVPKRAYMEGPKSPATVKMPDVMREALERVARERGWNFTDLVLMVLDQFLQQESGQ